MILQILITSFKEQLQRPAILALTLLTAPFFVFIYGALFPSDSLHFDVAILNEDPSTEIVGVLNVNDMYSIVEVESLDELKTRVENGSVRVGIHFRADFETSVGLLKAKSGYQIESFTFYGDRSDHMYGPAAIMLYASIEDYILNAAQLKPYIKVHEEFLGVSSNLKEFDYYIPGLLVFSLIILIFQVAMQLSRLVENHILKRLLLSRARAIEILSGYSISVIIVGMLSFLLTLLTGFVMGSQLSGDWAAVFLLAFLCALAITACGMIVAAFADTASAAFIIANLPMMLFMFLSGAMYPINRIPVFDILPTTHAVNGLHTILVMQGGIGDIIYELVSLSILTIIFAFIGVRLYYKRRMVFK